MSDRTYNGWANYATWRVNLEIFDGMTLDDFGDASDSAWLVGKALRDYAESGIYTSSEGLARDYALTFLSDVDWEEIAQHMIDDYVRENAEEEPAK
jgi:hypothetical protein